MDMSRRLGAEFFGTFWLTFAGCGSAVLAAGFPSLGIGFLGVSLAFGLTVLTMAYAVGHISGKYGLASCFLIEVIATFFFLYVIIGTTSRGAAVGFAGIPIGLCLTLIHLFLIPVTNASVNPARSTGPALFAGGAYIEQLWLFWLAPILGAAMAGVISRWQHDLPDTN